MAFHSSSKVMATPAFASGGSAADDRTEIAFFDVETSAPERCALLEFGAILICPRRLVEVLFYSTLVRPPVPVLTAARCNGITPEAIARAPPFRDVADDVYGILHGRVWAGHNIARFDARIIGEAFAEIGRPPPEPKGVIDTLSLLSRWFGRRAGDMRMASLANYFGLGRQTHRSLDDVRMNIQILKCCSTVLLLEANPPEVFPVTNNLLECAIPELQNLEAENPSLHDPPNRQRRTVCLAENAILQDRSIVQGTTVDEPVEAMNLDATMQMDSTSSSGYSRFLEPDDVSTDCIKISVSLLHRFVGPRTVIQHKGAQLQLRCADLSVRFGVCAKFLGVAGRPKLSVVVGIPDNLSKVLEFCDGLAKKSSPEALGTSEWKPLVRKYGHLNRPTVRLNIPTVDAATYKTDICKKERDGTTQKLVFGTVDAAELDSFLRWSKVDAFFSLEVYDYQQSAGIRLVAERLVVHSR